MEQTVRLSQRLQFIHRTSTVEEPATPESSGEKRVVPFQRHGVLMKVNVRINDTLVEPFYVDTGASSVVIPERLARALDLDVGPTAPRELVLTPAGVTEMKVVELTSLDLSGAKVRNLNALVSDRLEFGLLGGAFLRHFNYSVNSETGTILLEPISQ
jgi:clan AA aspartic protease (TIGR02281 family)